ncbi:hypothetical protein Taro_022753 [Colocasia esculenta]|uniref:Peroxisomal nicotinamide adenine dinucleotide carrier n=1 Tax=Colocasia esculenta TaxID=4460 RepID=A0A843V2S3_COLES|nr:hypothetical protein [Colocasia esculenta]
MSEALINGLAGAGGGIIAQLITYPLQTVNTRQQTDREPDKARARNGTIAQMCQVVRQEGWPRLYGGLAPSLVGTAASQVSTTQWSLTLALGPRSARAQLFASFFASLYVLAAVSRSQKSEETDIRGYAILYIVGVYYYFYQIFRSRAENAALDRWKRGLGDGSVGIFQSLVAAALSGCMNVLMTNPIWVVVTRMQTHMKTRNKQPSQPLPIGPDAEILTTAIEVSQYGTSHAVSIEDVWLLMLVQQRFKNSMVKLEFGVSGRVYFPHLSWQVTNPSIQFMLYETLLKKLKQRRATNTKGTDGITALEIFLLGALAKLGATVATYPLLVVKSRLQAKQVTSSDKRHHYRGCLRRMLPRMLVKLEMLGNEVVSSVGPAQKSTRDRGTLDAIAKMIKYEGLSGFYRGMSTKIVQSVLAAAVLFMVKEELVKGARLLVTGNARPGQQLNS